MGYAPPTSCTNTEHKENAVWHTPISKNKRRMETRNQILSMIQKFGNPTKNASTFKFGGWGWSRKERDNLGGLDVNGSVILKRILKEWSRDSAVGIVTTVPAGRSDVESLQGQEILSPLQIVWPTKPPSQWVPGLFLSGKAAGAWSWLLTSTNRRR
jgi:hypothetical protein